MHQMPPEGKSPVGTISSTSFSIPSTVMVIFSNMLLTAYTPFAFGSIKPTKYAPDIWEVTCSKGTKAYYITKTKQVINADDISSLNDFEWDFLVDNEWKRYSYISGIYECIN